MLYYREARDGLLLEEGITEAGAVSSWVAAATSYSVNNVPMLQFYIFYSMSGSAGRRPDLGRRRPASARVSHWRDGWTDNAGRRGASASGWIEPFNCGDHSQLPRL